MMKMRTFLKERRELCRISGWGAYFFGPSLLVSAGLFSVLTAGAVERLVRVPEVAAAYSQHIRPLAQQLQATDMSTPTGELLGALGRVAQRALWQLPTLVAFLLGVLLVVGPVYAGTVRWGVYLIEERQVLPLRAVFFYFLSPRLYFGSVLLSLRLFWRKAAAAVCFLLPPAVCFLAGYLLGGGYYGQGDYAGAVLLLSIVWFTLAVVLYLIFTRRYAAVRYLYALGKTRGVFRTSRALLRGNCSWFFLLQLQLFPNLLLGATVFFLPFALSRIFFGQALGVRALLQARQG